MISTQFAGPISQLFEEGGMQLSITGRNVDITDYTRGYVEKKMQRVERHLPALSEARVELSSESTT